MHQRHDREQTRVQSPVPAKIFHMEFFKGESEVSGSNLATPGPIDLSTQGPIDLSTPGPINSIKNKKLRIGFKNYD